MLNNCFIIDISSNETEAKMKVFTKTINGLKMEGYNDSGAEWVINSTDEDGRVRTTRYDRIINGKICTLKSVFELHADLFS